ERRLRVAAHEQELREGGLIEERHPLARGAMLGADGLEPVLPAIAVDIPGGGAGRREPVGAFPAELGAEAGARCSEALVGGRDAQGPAAFIPLMGPGHCVVLAIGLQRAHEHPAPVAVELAETADVDGPEIHRRLAAGDPLRERATGTARARYAEGIE